MVASSKLSNDAPLDPFPFYDLGVGHLEIEIGISKLFYLTSQKAGKSGGNFSLENFIFLFVINTLTFVIIWIDVCHKYTPKLASFGQQITNSHYGSSKIKMH